MRNLTPTELQEYLKTQQPFLLDVREPWEYQTCHLEGAHLIPMRDIPRRMSELDPARETVVICHHGVRSMQVAYFLEHSGFTNIINLSGGVAAWAHDVDSSMPTY